VRKKKEPASLLANIRNKQELEEECPALRFRRRKKKLFPFAEKINGRKKRPTFSSREEGEGIFRGKTAKDAQPSFQSPTMGGRRTLTPSRRDVPGGEEISLFARVIEFLFRTSKDVFGKGGGGRDSSLLAKKKKGDIDAIPRRSKGWSSKKERKNPLSNFKLGGEKKKSNSLKLWPCAVAENKRGKRGGGRVPGERRFPFRIEGARQWRMGSLLPPFFNLDGK